MDPHDDPLYLDAENWPLRVVEALDWSAEQKGNALTYVTAVESVRIPDPLLVQPTVTQPEESEEDS